MLEKFLKGTYSFERQLGKNIVFSKDEIAIIHKRKAFWEKLVHIENLINVAIGRGNYDIILLVFLLGIGAVLLYGVLSYLKMIIGNISVLLCRRLIFLMIQLKKILIFQKNVKKCKYKKLLRWQDWIRI